MRLPALVCAVLVSAGPVLHAGGDDWMAGFPDEARLSELSIPGTHNSGALHEPLPGTAACQALSIPDQLAAGVRFLDIRCRHVRDGLDIHHGVVFQKLTFDDVVADVLAFLDRHPTETVILSIQQAAGAGENTRPFADTVDACLARHPDRWLTRADIPTLGEARSRIVLLRRYDGSDRGIDGMGWDRKPSRHLRVQDRFRVTDNDEKWRAIADMFAATQGASKGSLSLNFTSGVKTRALGLPDIPAVSRVINARLARWLNENPAARRGVVVMDFVTPGLCELVIGERK